MKNKKFLALLAVTACLVAAVSVKPAMAYFTDMAFATGAVPVVMGNTPTDLEEELENMVKILTIKNTGNHDCFVRAIAIYGGMCEVEMIADKSEGWSRGSDGYYYYGKIVKPGETASPLQLKVTPVAQADEMGQKVAPEQFNVIISQEATQVHYDKDGNPFADWSTIYAKSTNNLDPSLAPEQSNPPVAPENLPPVPAEDPDSNKGDNE